MLHSSGDSDVFNTILFSIALIYEIFFANVQNEMK